MLGWWMELQLRGQCGAMGMGGATMACDSRYTKPLKLGFRVLLLGNAAEELELVRA